MSDPLHKCLTKATTATGDQRKHGPSWVTSRRAYLKLFDDHLECGGWRIDYLDIQDAVLFSFRSTVLRLSGYLLTVETKDRTYHFGLNGWGSFWQGGLPFAARREQGKLGFTWFSIALHLALVGCIAVAIDLTFCLLSRL